MKIQLTARQNKDGVDLRDVMRERGESLRRKAVDCAAIGGARGDCLHELGHDGPHSNGTRTWSDPKPKRTPATPARAMETRAAIAESVTPTSGRGDARGEHDDQGECMIESPQWSPAYEAPRGTVALHAAAHRRRAGMIGLLACCICAWPVEVDPDTLSGHASSCPANPSGKPRATHEHDFVGDGADCLECGEGRCMYLHNERRIDA